MISVIFGSLLLSMLAVRYCVKALMSKQAGSEG